MKTLIGLIKITGYLLLLKKITFKISPFVYTFEYDNYIEWRAFKFIKISKQWFYKLKIANLTDDFDVSIKGPEG